ncbi:hypothetical protein DPN68_04970 [Flavobacterium tibetense]|uniref:Uncharacterized protein n=1 Tax=Flavobacterium tibetense TaxID=2233533 RepID=A0A365P2I2_9FLAO|nr:hypothetical protein DPN68_04970 [Flavobacterium tibetense]
MVSIASFISLELKCKFTKENSNQVQIQAQIPNSKISHSSGFRLQKKSVSICFRFSGQLFKIKISENPSNPFYPRSKT